MKVFIVAYCFGGSTQQNLIGVYKRALRVGHALCDRGHEVSFYCAGRGNYRDEMTEAAERRMTFRDWSWTRPFGAGAEQNRQNTLAALRSAEPDVVVIGEAPLAGPLLELTLAAAELPVPVVCLDNAYNPDAAEQFCTHHGSMYDGLVLTGPSSFHTKRAPPYLRQVPPFIDASPQEARARLAELGLLGRRIVTVLAYDPNVETLGRSLLARLGEEDIGAVFVTHRPESCAERLAALPATVRDRARVIRPLDDRRHFGLLQESRLVVGKCAFMQVSECLSLRTPIIGFYFTGDFHLDLVPDVCHAFAHMTSDPDADSETVARARRFLDGALPDMHAVHDGSFGATSATAAFLEQLPRRPREETTAECARQGLTRDLLLRSLGPLHAGSDVEIIAARMSRLREMERQVLCSVLCRYSVDGRPEARRLWFRRFDGAAPLEAELDRARLPEAGRTVLLHSSADAYLIEQDIGEAALPGVHESAGR